MVRRTTLAPADKDSIAKMLYLKGTNYVADRYEVSAGTVRRFRHRHLKYWHPKGRAKLYKDRYFVYDGGRVWSIHYFAFLTPQIDKKGYVYYLLDTDVNVRAARLVLTVFKRPPKPGEVARHYKSREPSNNFVANLRWGTPKQNSADRDRHGTTSKLERHGCAKITNSHMLALRRRYKNGEKDIADRYAARYKMHPVYVSMAIRGKYWKGLL